MSTKVLGDKVEKIKVDNRVSQINKNILPSGLGPEGREFESLCPDHL